MSAGFRIKKFAAYLWEAKTKYYLHSPFVYNFFLHVLEAQTDENLQVIIQLRNQLRNDFSKIHLTDFGTGTSRTTTISHLEKHIALPHKYGRLLYALVKYLKPKNILEIGTSIGISSAYMALGNEQAQVTTLEGCPSLAKAAEQNHKTLNIHRVKVVEGEFSKTLNTALTEMPTVDLVLFDGNHTQQATLAYFQACLPYVSENTVFVFDDIYWNSEMCKAWNTIKQHPTVTLTIDVYRFGICFFRKEKLAKEDFVLRY
ncbi:MAG: class I SAM-dependent methyltransferase [Chitinophagales bacterium]|nr:class I SAM-dependent methyltransferase [Chitinophagales bacterium]